MIEQELRERIDALVDDETHPDWSDVVRRTAAAPPPERRRPRALSGRRRIAVALVLAAAIAAVVALLPGRIGGHHRIGVVAQALAAVSQGPVLHAVLQVPARETWAGPKNEHPVVDVLDVASGRVLPVLSELELWYDPDRGLAFQVESVNGTISWQSLQTPTATYDDRGPAQPSTSPARIDPGLTAFLKGYKQALADGTATDAGSGNVGGRDVEWLRFPPITSDGVPEEVAVDRTSFEAVAVRAVCPTCSMTPPTYTVATLEGVARSAIDFSPPRAVDPHPVKLYTATYEPGTPGQSSSYLGRQTYWAGPSVGGLAFTGVELDRPANYSTDLPSPGSVIAAGKGVTFHYGAPKPPAFDAAPGQPYLTIGETADVGFAFHGFNMEELSHDGLPLTVARTVVPPEGQAILTDVGVWVAQLRKGDLYVEIDGTSREAVVGAAQALSATP